MNAQSLSRNLNSGVLISILAFFILVPILIILFISFTQGGIRSVGTLNIQNYVRIFTEPSRQKTIVNTLLLGLIVSSFATLFGLVMAFMIWKTDTPLRKVVKIIPLVPYFFPPLVGALAWSYLANPFNGFLNIVWKQIFGSPGPFNIYTFGGMAWVLGLYVMPLAYTILSNSLTSVDASLEEGSYVCGVRTRGTLYKVVLPLITPGLIASFIMSFVFAATELAVPLVIGKPAKIDLLATSIWMDIQYGSGGVTGGIVTASASCGFLLVLAGSLMYGYHQILKKERRFATVTGRGFKLRITSGGRWRYVGTIFILLFLVVTVVLPITIVLFASLQPYWGAWPPKTIYLNNYVTVFATPNFWTAFVNSLVLAIGAGIITSIVALVTAFTIYRTKLPGRKMLDILTTLPLATPGVVIGLSIFYMWVNIPGPVFGTALTLLIALATAYLPYAARPINAGMLKLSSDMEESSLVCGAKPWRTYFNITIPLLTGDIAAGLILVFISSLRALAPVLFLYGPKTIVMPILLWNWIDVGELSYASALSIFFIMLMSAATALLYRFGRLGGVGR